MSLVRTYGVLIAAEVVMALAFEAVMIKPGQLDLAILSDAADYPDMRANPLQQWGSTVKIGGVAAFLFFLRNADLIAGYRPVGCLGDAYNLAELIGILGLIHEFARVTYAWPSQGRPDSPSDRGPIL